MRKVFFSFHYDRDSWRVSQVRNSWVVRGQNEAQPFLDRAGWEDVKAGGTTAVEKWIQANLAGTSVTVVLIGAETASRKWVEYEIAESHNKGKGIFGIYIHKLQDRNGEVDYKGNNPFSNLSFVENGRRVYLSEVYPVYDWVDDSGRTNIGKWIEEAARRALR